MSRIRDLVEELRVMRDRVGYGNFDEAVRTLNRERLQSPRTEKRVKFKWSTYVNIYNRQKGICPWCGLVMPLIRGKIELDHRNPSAPPGMFNDPRNLQVTHSECNRTKSAMTMEDQAKHLGIPVTAILNGGRAPIEEEV